VNDNPTKYRVKNTNFESLQNPVPSLTLREEHRLRVFENKVLRRIFGPKRDQVTGGWRKNCIMRSFVISTFRQV
jgi:hypothetical protein